MENPPELQKFITLRQYLAGQALNGYLSRFDGSNWTIAKPEYAAEEAIKYADALIKQLEK